VNFQLIAVILLVILYPIGFRITMMARIREPSRKEILTGLFVLLLFLASFIYLLISSWRLFIMMLGSVISLLIGTAAITNMREMSQKATNFPEDYAYLKGRVRRALFASFIFLGVGISLFILSIIRCLG
jgi:cytochrome c biogenesis factor